MEALAQKSYELVNGKCPKLPPCDEPTTLQKTARQTSEAGENLLLSSLADRRSQVLQCQLDDLHELQKDPQKFEKIAQDLSEKIDTLVQEKRNLKKLEEAAMTLGGSAKVTTKELRDADARIEALIKSMPLIEVPGVQAAIKSQILRRKGGVLGAPDSKSDQLNEVWRESLKQALMVGDKELSADQQVLKTGVESKGFSLPRGVRESLTQDQDLLEGYRQKKETDEETLKTLSCRIDSKYGRGASYRDNAIAAGLMAATGLGTAVAKVGSLALTSSITGRAAEGVISLRAAGVLRTVGNAGLMTANVAVGADQAWKVCMDRAGHLSGDLGSDQKNVCRGVSIRSLDQDNCVLAAVFMASGPASALIEGANASKVWAASKLERKAATAQAKTTKTTASAAEPEIDRTNRPARAIPDSGRQVDRNEVVSSGFYPRSIEDSKKFLQSEDFREGTYVMMVVREKNGKDVLMYENRVPANVNDVLEERYVSHRSLRQKYRDLHGDEPDVVAAGECVVNTAGRLVSCLNQSGSYKEGNQTVDYLAKSAEHYGFKGIEDPLKKRNMKPGENFEVGHLKAYEEVVAEKKLMVEHPQFLKDAKEVTRILNKEVDGQPTLMNDREWLRRARDLGRKPNPEWPEEKNKAYRDIFVLMTSVGEGATAGAARVLKTMENSPTLKTDLNLIHRYLPEFLRDAAKKP